MERVLRGYRDNQQELRDSIQDVRDKQPPTLSAAYFHPDKEEAITAHVSRFNI